MKRALIILAAVVAVGVFTWFFPLFRVVSRESLRAEQEQQSFNAAAFVESFWQDKLPPAFSGASDAQSVLTALRETPDQARTQFGRTAGIGRESLYFIRGSGKVVSVDKKAIAVSLGDDEQVDLTVQTGLLFGNTVRDATGLLSADDYPNSQQFNEISSELNRTIEATVLPPLRTAAKVGAEIEFVGCAAVTNLPRDITPLKVVPLEVKFR